ncbi:MAG: hypothetical protein QOF98_2667, partial [Streptomyces sp.]|nr:hypothetical protein [Streptomyces sp.]
MSTPTIGKWSSFGVNTKPAE